MKQFELYLHSEADTRRFGHALAASLPPGATVGLIGTLGAGKTRLVQAVAEACGIERDRVVSPTFTICNEYRGTPSISHLDLYRVADEDELLELGIEEYFDAPELTLVEWADRFAAHLPPERFDVQMDISGESSRRVTVTAHGPAYEAALQRLRERWERPAA